MWSHKGTELMGTAELRHVIINYPHNSQFIVITKGLFDLTLLLFVEEFESGI